MEEVDAAPVVAAVAADTDDPVDTVDCLPEQFEDEKEPEDKEVTVVAPAAEDDDTADAVELPL